MNTQKKITIIILNYNTKHLTLRAIRSCLDLAFKNIDVVVVDNASTDGSVKAFAQLVSKEKRVRLMSLSKNNGFAAGNNVALREATTEYVMLLNSDAYFPEGADIESALDFMDEYQDIAVVSPFVKLPNGRIDPASHRGFPTPWNAWTYFLGLEKLSSFIPGLNMLFGGYHQTWKNMSYIHDIDACTGAAMILRREAVEEVGLLDEQFFMYGEDLDWCFRFREDEWRIVFFPNLKVVHDKHSSGLKKKASKSKDAFYEAMKLFYDKHYKHSYPAFITSLTYAGINLAKNK